MVEQTYEEGTDEVHDTLQPSNIRQHVKHGVETSLDLLQVEVVLKSDNHHGLSSLLIRTPCYLVHLKRHISFLQSQKVQVEHFVLKLKILTRDKKRYFYLSRAHDWYPLAEAFLNKGFILEFLSIKTNPVHAQEDVFCTEPVYDFLLASAVVVTKTFLENDIYHATGA